MSRDNSDALLNASVSERQPIDDLLTGGIQQTVADVDTSRLIDEVSNFFLSSKDPLGQLPSSFGIDLTDSGFVDSLKLGAADLQKGIGNGLDSLGGEAATTLEDLALNRLHNWVNSQSRYQFAG